MDVELLKKGLTMCVSDETAPRSTACREGRLRFVPVPAKPARTLGAELEQSPGAGPRAEPVPWGPFLQ